VMTLKVLTINCGSSTLKFKVMGVWENTALGQQEANRRDARRKGSSFLALF